MSTRAPAKTTKHRAPSPAAARKRAAVAGNARSAAAAPTAEADPAVRVIAISGSQSGLGLAIRERLSAAGVRTIGIDLPGKGAEVEADLSKASGRKQAVEGVLELCHGRLDGLVANAGVDAKDAKLTFGVNYHGAVDLLEGLRPALAAAAPSAAVATVSHAVMVTPGVRSAAADALLDGRDGRAALLAGDFSVVGELSERSALAMHASAMAAGVVYFRGTTLDVYRRVRELRAAGRLAFATMDAGPHVKVLTSEAEADALAADLAGVPGVLRVITARPGPGARVA